VETELFIRDIVKDNEGLDHASYMALNCKEMENLYVQYMVQVLNGDALAEHEEWRDVAEWRCEAGGHPFWCPLGSWC